MEPNTDIESNAMLNTILSPTRMGHLVVYKLLKKEVQTLVRTVLRDYKIKPMDQYEIEKIFLSPHYLSVHYPQTLEEHEGAVKEHLVRRRRMVSSRR
jgi:hypothetical protein